MIYEVLKYIRADFKDNNLLIVKAMPTIPRFEHYKERESGVQPYTYTRIFFSVAKAARESSLSLACSSDKTTHRIQPSKL